MSVTKRGKGEFYDALTQLVQAHESEINRLEFENSTLRSQATVSEDIVLEERRSDYHELLANGDEFRQPCDLESSKSSSPTRKSLLCIPEPPEVSKCYSLDATLPKSLESSTEYQRISYVDIPTTIRSSRGGTQGSTDMSARASSPTRYSRSRSFPDGPPEHGDFILRSQWQDLPESVSEAWEQDLDQMALEENTKKLLDLTKDPNDQVLQKDFARRSSVSNIVSYWWKRGLPLVDPGSPKRMTWDVVGTFLIGYDLITIPLMVFEPEDTWLTDAIAWTCLCFWTLDMVATNCTGIYKDGDLIMDRRIIMKEYLRYWFAIDCVVVIPDWIITIAGSSQRYGRLGRILRAARVVRILRLFRILKLRKLLNAIYDRIASEYMFLVVELIKLLTLILTLNHFVACAWYLVGTIARLSGTSKNWLQDVGTTPVWNGDVGWKYSTSLHWSITQFTPASMDIFATNTGERIFSVFILFWGLVTLSSVVGSVTASITAIRSLSGDQQKHFWMLRQYLKQRCVSRDTSSRIIRYLEFKMAEKKNMLPEGKVLLLSQVSEQLSFHLLREIKGPILEVHPFFFVLSMHMAGYMDRICNQALKTIECAVSDSVFDEGWEAIGMYFVAAGYFRYRDSNKNLQKNTFISEAALWTHWRHRGSLTGIGEVNEIITILHGPFAGIMGTHPKPWLYCKRYAEGFVKYISECDLTKLSDIFAEKLLSEHEYPTPNSGSARWSHAKS